MKQNKPRTSKFFNSNLITTLSIAMVLFLVGLVCVLSLGAKAMADYVKENITFSVVLFDEATDEDRQLILQELQTAPYAKSVKYISKEQALQDMIGDDFGENPQEFVGYNPLPASFEVNTKAEYTTTQNMENIKQSLSKFTGVHEIQYQQNTIDSTNSNIQTIAIFLLGAAALLLIVSIGLINNTIRLQIYSKRFLINTMKLVGATSWFIRKPFLAKGIMNGFIAALLASLCLGGLIYYIKNYHAQEMDVSSLLYPIFTMLDIKILGFIAGIMLCLGMAISFFSSLFAVGKYLRHKTNDLYYI